MSEPADSKKIEWLTLLVYCLILGALVISFFLAAPKAEKGGTWIALTIDVLPNLIASVLVALAAYWFFKRKAIPLLASTVSQATTGESQLGSDLVRRGVEGFYERFGDVAWRPMIKEATTIDIVTWYFDSWMRNNRDDLKDFFERGGQVRLIMPDPREASLLQLGILRYPEHSASELGKKIVDTGIKLHDLVSQAGSASAKVEVYLSSQAPSFSSVRFDLNFVILSLFDQFRAGQINSPAFKLNLRKSDKLRQHWECEIGGFLNAQLVAGMPELQQIRGSL